MGSETFQKKINRIYPLQKGKENMCSISNKNILIIVKV